MKYDYSILILFHAYWAKHITHTVYLHANVELYLLLDMSMFHTSPLHLQTPSYVS